MRGAELGAGRGTAVAAAAGDGVVGVTVACEPTGSRWMQVQRLCRRRGWRWCACSRWSSHIAREQEDFTAHKRDEPDAVLIARLAAELHCYVPEELDGVVGLPARSSGGAARSW